MATRRQLRADRDAAEQRATEAEQRARGLAAELVKVRDSLFLATTRAARQADRILNLERDAKEQPAGDVDAENAHLRRQLAATQKQLDDATKDGDDGWNWAPRPAPRPDGEVSS